MHIKVQQQEHIILSQLDSDEIEIELENEAMYFGAISMFVASLGRCTFAVLSTYAIRLDLDTDKITVSLDWDYLNEPTRINNIRMKINWPELPEKRIKSVQRATHMCTIHTTIHECVAIETVVSNI